MISIAASCIFVPGPKPSKLQAHKVTRNLGGITPPQMTLMFDALLFLSDFINNGTRVLWPAANVETPII